MFIRPRPDQFRPACGSAAGAASPMSESIRALIVDDEPLARDRLRGLLQEVAGVEILGECINGIEAVEAIRRQRPDVVFLDIQMPEVNGFGVLERLGSDVPPAIVFTTAYDKFALQAFEVHAVDYLLKPFDTRRFQKAIERVKTTLRRPPPAPDWQQQIQALLADIKGAGKGPERIAVKTGGKVLLVRFDDIDWIESADNYVNLHVGAEHHLHRETMAALEGRLPENKFLRISRSAIINVERVKELHPLFHGEYTVVLRNGTRLTLSRSYRDRLQHLLGKEE